MPFFDVSKTHFYSINITDDTDNAQTVSAIVEAFNFDHNGSIPAKAWTQCQNNNYAKLNLSTLIGWSQSRDFFQSIRYISIAKQ